MCEYDNLHYNDLGCDGEIKDIDIQYRLSEIFDIKKYKYFHNSTDIKKSSYNEKYLYTLDIVFKLISIYDLEINLKNDRIISNEPICKSYILLRVHNCKLCDIDTKDYYIEFGEDINLEYCSYYENAAKIIQKRVKWNQKLSILWKIAEYYTKQKYSSDNIIKCVELYN